jgi:phytoene desaturase
VFQTIDSYVSRVFKDLRARQIIEYAMVFLGDSPGNAPALYSLISYLDMAQEEFFPAGGTYAIVEGLASLCKEYGVIFDYEANVVRIQVANGRVKGVRGIPYASHHNLYFSNPV